MEEHSNDSDEIVGPEFTTVVDLLIYRAIHRPNFLVFTFLAQGEKEEQNLTNIDVDRKARAIGAWLRSSFGAGERALLCTRGAEFVTALFGSLYGGLVAVPTHPPDHDNLQKTISDLDKIVRDAQPVVGFTTEAFLSAIQGTLAENASLKGIHWVVPDHIKEESSQDWQRPTINGETVALIQYTSGSTSDPRGVVVTHKSLLEASKTTSDQRAYCSGTTCVSWVPLESTGGLRGGVLVPLFSNARSILMSPEALLQKPIRWLKAISHYRAVRSGGPNFAYELCVDRIAREECIGLDLRSWKIALVGGEAANLAILDRFASVFAPNGFARQAFLPNYNLTESFGCVVSASPVFRGLKVLDVESAALQRNKVFLNLPNAASVIKIVSSGPILADRVEIVDPGTGVLCPADRVGEIWVMSKYCASGYWNKPQESELTFNAVLSVSQESPFLRTGDLGFIHDEELFVTGRLKDMMVIRGRNIYPQDVERSIEACHGSLRPGTTAVFSVHFGVEERMVIVQELDDSVRAYSNEIVGAIRGEVLKRHSVLAYGIVLVKTASIPKTATGKVRRRACREEYLAQTFEALESSVADYSAHRKRSDHVAAHTKLEKELTEMWCAILDIKECGVLDNFIELGGQSIFATLFLNRVRDTYHVEIPIAALFSESGCIREIADAIEKMDRRRSDSKERKAEPEHN